MKCGIVTFEKYLGRKNIGSSKIRGEWLINHWPEAEIFNQGEKYDVVIYQKAYWVEHAKVFNGIKILDICDPDFLSWRYRIIEMIEEVDAITTSTEALVEVFRNFTNKPVLCIPDRVDLEAIPKIKYHKGDAKMVGWYGYSTGFDMVKPVLFFLKKLNLGLTIISDNGFTLPMGYEDLQLVNLPHSWDTIYEDLLDTDIIVNPKSIKGRFKYKSNNKTILAWALGLPVADNVNDLERFKKEEERRKEQVLRLQEVKDKWDIRLSVSEYQNLISQLIKK